MPLVVCPECQAKIVLDEGEQSCPECDTTIQVNHQHQSETTASRNGFPWKRLVYWIALVMIIRFVTLSMTSQKLPYGQDPLYESLIAGIAIAILYPIGHWLIRLLNKNKK
ncbi:MAG TPA: hypothetical protein VGO47_04025 [Chlamydiales bacterium]|nr:hypothetical protein [Chlamydiales bacterium]